MPDDYGNFRGYRGTGQPLPWLQVFEPGQRVRITATQQHGTVIEQQDDGLTYVGYDDNDLATLHEPGDLRPLT